MREGLPLPQKIANAPTLQLGLQLFWVAFMELSSCRSSAMGLGRIPWTAIKDWALAYELDEEQADDLFHAILAMDSAYLDHESKKDKKKNKTIPTGKAAKPKGSR